MSYFFVLRFEVWYVLVRIDKDISLLYSAQCDLYEGTLPLTLSTQIKCTSPLIMYSISIISSCGVFVQIVVMDSH